VVAVVEVVMDTSVPETSAAFHPVRRRIAEVDMVPGTSDPAFHRSMDLSTDRRRNHTSLPLLQAPELSGAK